MMKKRIKKIIIKGNMEDHKRDRHHGKMKMFAFFILLFPLIALGLSFLMYGWTMCIFVAIVAVLLGMIILLLILMLLLLAFIAKLRKMEKPTPIVDFFKEADKEERTHEIDEIMQSAKYRQKLEREEEVDLRLLKFIDKARKLGLDYAEIKSRLMKYGWAHHEISPTMEHHKVHGDRKLREAKQESANKRSNVKKMNKK